MKVIYQSVQKSFIDVKGRLYDKKSKIKRSSSQSTIINKENVFNNNESFQVRNYDENYSKPPLPRLQVPKFSGKRDEWKSFRDMFLAVVHNKKSIGPVEKFYYLRSYLENDAKAVLDGIPLTGSNSDVAWNRLLSRYDNKHLLITGHINSILTLKPLKEESAQGLQLLQDKMNQHRESLKTLEQPVSMWDVWFTHLVGKVMDSNSRRDWEQKIGYDDVPSYTKLMDFLTRRIRMLSATEANNGFNICNKTKNKEVIFDSKKRAYSNPSSKVLVTYSNQICGLCNDAHHTSRCEKFRSLNLNERRASARKYEWCYNCLGKGHDARVCPSNGICKTCKGRHHTLLHAEKRRNLHMKGGSPAKRICKEPLKPDTQSNDSSS